MPSGEDAFETDGARGPRSWPAFGISGLAQGLGFREFGLVSRADYS